VLAAGELGLRAGWLYTGDIGELDADGYLWIRDRKKDMAIVGGYNVYPQEVDEVLFSHPAVKEAAAAGVPDPYYGECIRAYVVLKEGAQASIEELLARCAANLARYKVPSKLFLVSELPRTSVGKIGSGASSRRRELTGNRIPSSGTRFFPSWRSWVGRPSPGNPSSWSHR
jgi:long-chain acyl-CoA synthetase